jgi:hypothetical protein
LPLTARAAQPNSNRPSSQPFNGRMVGLILVCSLW